MALEPAQDFDQWIQRKAKVDKKHSILKFVDMLSPLLILQDAI